MLIDDATSCFLQLRFVKAETTFDYFDTVKSYLLEHGKPSAFYVDKHNVFKVNHAEAKSGGVLHQGIQIRYAMIKKNIRHFELSMMCRVLCVSRSGYYDWCKGPESPRAQDNAKLASEIKEIFDDEDQRAGSVRTKKMVSFLALGKAKRMGVLFSY